MSVIVEIKDVAKLNKARSILRASSDSETLEMALEKVIGDGEGLHADTSQDLPQSFWDELFSQHPVLPANTGSHAIIEDRNEAQF